MKIIFLLQMKDVPKLGGPDSLFFRAAGVGSVTGVGGLTPSPGPGYAPRLSLTSPHQYSASGGAAGQPSAPQHQTKVRQYRKTIVIARMLQQLYLFVFLMC